VIFTRDLASVAQFHAEPIGEKRSRTPEGYLVCHDVPLARTGFQEYGGWEIEDPAVTPADKYRVERLEEHVFSPESIASWHGKAVTNDHPPALLTPETDKLYRVGTMINPRRGEGDKKDLLLVDMIVTCPQLMQDIDAGKREVSGGYDCDYFEVRPGHLQQRGIVGNHGAVVEQGRCGVRCAIGDEDQPRAKAHTRRRSMDVLNALRRALKSGNQQTIDKAAVQAILDAEGEEPTVEGHSVHIHVGGQGENSAGKEEQPPKKEDPMDEAPPWFKQHHKETSDRWGAHDAWTKGMDEWRKGVDTFMKGEGAGAGNHEIEGGELEMEAPPGTALNDAKGAKDSALLADSFQETCAGAEVLAPGISLPTLNRNAPPKTTFDAICGLRRRALDHAMSSAETRQAVLDCTGGRGIDTKKATCRDVRTTFRAVVAMRRAANAEGNRDTKHTTYAGTPTGVGGISSLTELNAMNQKHYENVRAANSGRR
jgi:hypothetical protein